MTTPIIANSHNGHPVVAGPAATIRAALGGAAPLTITGQHATGDTVWLAPIVRQVWDDGVVAEAAAIARTIQHPTHGEIIYAYIDTARLDQAPQIAALDRQRRSREYANYAAAQARGQAMVPDCDNCGDCPQCC